MHGIDADKTGDASVLFWGGFTLGWNRLGSSISRERPHLVVTTLAAILPWASWTSWHNSAAVNDLVIFWKGWIGEIGMGSWNYCPYSEFWILKASLQMSMIAPWSMVTKKAYFRQFNTTSVPMSTTACVADINSLRRKTGFLFDCTFLYTHISLFPWHLYTIALADYVGWNYSFLSVAIAMLTFWDHSILKSLNVPQLI